MKMNDMRESQHQTALFQRYPSLRDCENELNAALATMTTAYEGGGKLLICGNGGSAADSEHVVAELMKGFRKPRSLPQSEVEKLTAFAGAYGTSLGAKLQGGLPAISLVSHVSLITAVANDLDADLIFAQQVYVLGQPGDVLLAISTSGNSRNIVNAVTVANAFGLRAIGLTGKGGGEISRLAEITIRVPKEIVADIQELHLPVYHWLSTELEERFFPAE
ncbi:MAG: SIS domain-containing protein [Chthoniobacterales bacterium]